MSKNWYKIASYPFYKKDSMGGEFPVHRIDNLKDALAFLKLPVHWATQGIPDDFTAEDLKRAKSAIFRDYRRDINMDAIAQLEADAYRIVKNSIEKND